MTARITTRAGRKIRHVAPGHVVDVATNITIRIHRQSGPAAYWLPVFPSWWQIGLVGPGLTLDGVLLQIAFAEPRAIAAGVCALVRALVEAWQAHERAAFIEECREFGF